MPPPSALSLQAFLPYRLSVTTNLVSDVIACAYQDLFGLRIPEWRVVAVLAEQQGLTQLDAGLATRMDKVTVSRAAAALARRGLIERRLNPKDGRSQQLFLSKAGEALYAQVAPKALQLEQEIAGELDATERERFMDMLQRLERRALEIAHAASTR